MRDDLWVLGNLTIDDVVLFDGTTAMGLCGGGAIFAALGGRLWSEHVALAARVGPDYSRASLQQIESAGIRLSLSEVAAPTLHHWALYESAEHRQFVKWLSSGSHFEQSLLPPEVPAAPGLGRVCHIAPMPLEVQARLVRFLAPLPALVSLDPHDEYITGAEDTLLDLLALVDLFMPSRNETALLFGRDAPEEAARAFAARGPRVVVVKLGGEGSLVAAGSRPPFHVPVVPVRSVDPTGAGDAYCGAFGVTYVQTADALESALRATVAASVMVEHRGTDAVLPFDRDVARQRLAWLRQQVDLPKPENGAACQ